MTPRSPIDTKGLIFLGLLALACLLVPLLNLVVPESSPLHLPTYLVSLFGKYLSFALLAVALDLVWGYCGILSLGHGAFFGLGGYAMGMYLMRQIGPRGVYGNPILPDFMVFLNYKELPWYWLGFDHFAFAAFMVLAVPGLLAFVFGWLAFRSRVTGVYLSIVTQALTFALMLAFFRNDMGLGGNNGLTDFKDILGYSVQAQGVRNVLFVATGIALAIGYLVARFMTVSAYGKVLISVRDAESRTRFLGYRPEHYKTLAFTVSAMMAGVAGALYVPQVGIINPGEFAPTNSIEAVIWVAVGGRGTLVGAALGAVLVNYVKSVLTGALPDAWLFALGALFVLVTLFMPRGIVGLLVEQFGSRRAAAKLPPAPQIAPKLVEEGRLMSEAAVLERPKQAPPAVPSVPAGPDTRLTPALLYLDDVRVTFDGYRALRGLSLTLGPGEMRAIIGPNGAGKTTMMNCITGKTRPDLGTLVFDGMHDLTKLDEPAIADLGIGRKFQKPTVFESHTVADNILLALKGPRAAFASLFGWRNRVEAQKVDALLAKVGLIEHRARPAADLSHGQKQWLEIGMLLAQDPKLLLVDEPVAGMTDAETSETAKLLREIAKSHAVVVIEHDMHFVRALECRVTCLHEGAVLAEGSIDAVSADPKVVEVYLGR